MGVWAFYKGISTQVFTFKTFSDIIFLNEIRDFCAWPIVWSHIHNKITSYDEILSFYAFIRTFIEITCSLWKHPLVP